MWIQRRTPIPLPRGLYISTFTPALIDPHPRCGDDPGSSTESSPVQTSPRGQGWRTPAAAVPPSLLHQYMALSATRGRSEATFTEASLPGSTALAVTV